MNVGSLKRKNIKYQQKLFVEYGGKSKSFTVRCGRVQLDSHRKYLRWTTDNELTEYKHINLLQHKINHSKFPKKFCQLTGLYNFLKIKLTCFFIIKFYFTVL